MTACSSKQSGILIVGAGQAGTQLAFSLREEGFSDPITLIGDETHLPYQRLPLSKGYLLGNVIRDNLLLRPEQLFQKGGIILKLGSLVSAINPELGTVRLSDDTELTGSAIVLATGSSARPMSSIAKAENVHYLRNLDDADRLASGLKDARHVTIVGGGFIGLEFAAVARCKFGCDVTVIEAGPQILGRMSSRATASHIHQRLTEWGVTIIVGARADCGAIDERERVSLLQLGDGMQIETDMVLICIGGIANGSLVGAPLGVTVDGRLCVAPGLYALGDCALFPDADGTLHRVESVQNALDQARYLAKRFTNKEDKPFTALNWFWSDIGDMKLQIAGRASERDDTLSYPRGENRQTVFRFRNDELTAVETINSPADHMLAKRLLADNHVVRKEQIEITDGDLKRCVA